MKRHQNDIQPFERLAFWMNWFDQSFKKNLSVDYLPSVRERAHREILNKTDQKVHILSLNPVIILSSGITSTLL